MSDISIIVPIYNSSKYLNKCIDSLVNQTKKELEFILINDGSTDNSEEIIKKYKDKRIKYFKNKNQGIGKSRNFGIEKATSKYLMFIDSDDYLDINACEKLYDNAIKNNSDIVICNYYKVINNKNEEVKLIDFDKTSLNKMPNLIIDINLAPWNKLYKKDLIIKNNIRFEEKLKYEDAPFVSICFDKAKIISKENEQLNYYVIHTNSETTIRDKRIFDILKIVEIIRKYFEDKVYMDDSIKKLIVKILTNYNIQQRNQKDIKLGIKFIDESFNYIKKYVVDYKNNKYYKDRGFIRRTIEKSRLLSIIYCYNYYLFRKK